MDPVRWVLVAAAAAGIWTSRKLWQNQDRYCPQVPMLGNLPPVDLPVRGLLLGALASTLFLQPVVAFSVLALVVTASCLYDWGRVTPWLYQYVFMLGSLALLPPAIGLDGCRLILICIYFWSGLSKFSLCYHREVYPYLLGPLQNWIPKPLQRLGELGPVWETGIGLCLLFGGTRWLGILGAVAMHSFILLALGPWGLKTNSNIWPWNLAMMVLVTLLFWQSGDVAVRRGLEFGFFRGIVWLFGAMPFLGYFGRWDSILCFRFFTGRELTALLMFSSELYHRLPAAVQKLCLHSSGFITLDIRQWYMSELNVIPYPEERVYRGIARSFSRYQAGPQDLQLVIFGRPPFNSTRRPTKVLSWSDLQENRFVSFSPGV